MGRDGRRREKMRGERQGGERRIGRAGKEDKEGREGRGKENGGGVGILMRRGGEGDAKQTRLRLFYCLFSLLLDLGLRRRFERPLGSVNA